jgi:hypothetical protein
MMRRRPWVAAPAGLAVALALMLSCTTAAQWLPSVRLLGRASRLAPLNYGADAFALLSPVRLGFIEERLGRVLLDGFAPTISRAGAAHVINAVSRNPSATPGPRPAPAPGPTPRPPLIPGANSIGVRMAANDRQQPFSVRAGDSVVYSVVARNQGRSDFIGTASVSTHVPLFTFYCAAGVTLPEGQTCTVAGTYDGSSQDPADAHLVPPTVDVPVNLGAGKESVLYRFRVSVSSAAPAGAALPNHAHVGIVGGTEGPLLAQAPLVTVE